MNLSSAVSVDDVINDINTAAAAAGVGITASVNQAGNGIQLTDTTGSTAGNLIVADADSSDTAESLGIAVDAAQSSVNSGDLHLQSVSENTLLSLLQRRRGVAQGSFKITGTNGHTATINVGSTFNTVGDVINAINAANVGVAAEINSTGDGIELVDTAHGSGTLRVTAGSTTTAQDLHLTAAPSTTTIGGQSTQIINGSTTTTVAITSSDSLQSLISKINGADAGVQASEVNTGSEINPYRLVLTAEQGGLAGNLQFDTSNSPISLTQTTAGQDALLLVGSGSSGFVASSPTDTFSNVLAGANITLTGTSATPVSLTVAQDPSSLASAIQSVVTGYNSLVSNIRSATAYNTTTNTGAVLEGNTAVLQVQDVLSNLVSGQLAGNFGGSIQSLANLGISVNQDGSLSLNTSTLSSLLASNPQGVQQFLATANTGPVGPVQTALTQLAAPVNSVLSNTTAALNTDITNNQTQISQMQAQLTVEQNAADGAVRPDGSDRRTVAEQFERDLGDPAVLHDRRPDRQLFARQQQRQLAEQRFEQHQQQHRQRFRLIEPGRHIHDPRRKRRISFYRSAHRHAAEIAAHADRRCDPRRTPRRIALDRRANARSFPRDLAVPGDCRAIDRGLGAES